MHVDACRCMSMRVGACRRVLTRVFTHVHAQTFAQRLRQQYTCYTVFFISIEMCQIADVLIRKTRRLSLLQQGLLRNHILVIAIVFQVSIGCFLCYCPGMPYIFNFMPIRFQWWLVPMPFGILILLYDEIRKLGVRRHPGSE
nr:PREDICTED: potassium-transporting ATPase alpha chain 1-like [Apteryx mantelli mantelli]